MNLNESVNKSYQLRQQIKDLENQEADIKAKKALLEQELELVDSGLLDEIKRLDKSEIEVDGLFLNHFKRVNVGYTSDADVLKYLKDNGFTSLFKTKVTESLDKNAIKKELKTNTALQEALSKFIVEKLTEYVTVTDAENHAKMLEHIEEGGTK
jgi:hypothetical protein